ncbi:response regulator [Magnetofaba australis]|uniref:histidine kinase n=1 Tax=Magnetofaba australis IT-1 TaxID=1434232 RepID=A0A1Y2K0F9_9PROT|nr:response regulator [Magnetofaba australis]OSM01511.1 putative Two-component system protein A [Magnetofaba australis IT-1]
MTWRDDKPQFINESTDYSWAHAAGFSVRQVNRKLMEKTLYMRAQSYLSQVRSKMLSETLFEIDMRRRKSDDYAQELAKQKAYADKQRHRLESANAELEQRVLERTRELLVHKERAERASMAKSRFMSMVSHELLTPMNTIQGMADLLAEQTQSDQQMAWIDAQRKSCRTLLEVIESILIFTDEDVARREDPNAPPKIFSPAEITRQIHQDFQAWAGEKSLDFSVLWSSEAPALVSGDSRVFYIILKGLLSNAIKFTDSGAVGVTLNWRPQEGGRGVLNLSVRDTGIGINREALATLFQPLQQLESGLTRNFQGLGMGLSLCRSLVERQKGVISANSEPGQGSAFRVALPYMLADKRIAAERTGADAANTPPQPSTPECRAQASEPEAQPTLPNVLLVEDCKENIFLMKAYLSKFPCKLTLAYNGEEALQQVEQAQGFDLILMDIQMPVIDGLTAMRHIRRIESERSWARQAMLVLSAHGLEQDRAAGFAAGCDDYLTKPIGKKTLIEAMERWLNIARDHAAPESPGR